MATTTVSRVRLRSTMCVPPCEAGVKPMPPRPASRPECIRISPTSDAEMMTWMTAKIWSTTASGYQRSGRPNRMPALPGDPENDDRDDQSDDRIGQAEPERDDSRACKNAEADEAVNASVLAVGYQGRAVQPASGSKPHLSGDLVTDEADQAR